MLSAELCGEKILSRSLIYTVEWLERRLDSIAQFSRVGFSVLFELALCCGSFNKRAEAFFLLVFIFVNIFLVKLSSLDTATKNRPELWAEKLWQLILGWHSFFRGLFSSTAKTKRPQKSSAILLFVACSRTSSLSTSVILSWVNELQQIFDSIIQVTWIRYKWLEHSVRLCRSRSWPLSARPIKTHLNRVLFSCTCCTAQFLLDRFLFGWPKHFGNSFIGAHSLC